MSRLLSANFNRLWIDRGFWITVILMVCIQGICCFLMLRNNEEVPMDVVLFMSLLCINVLVAIFYSLFLGTEYSDGTIRNKLIVGHKRSHIYLASLITGIIAITILFLSGVLTGSIIGILFYAAPQNNIGQIILAGVIGWIACISFISIFNLIGMLSSNKSTTAIVCMLIAFASLFSGFCTLQLLSKPDLIGVKREIYQILFDVNPYGQLLQVMSVNLESPLKLATYSLILSLICTILGLYVFWKKDLK